MIPSFSPREFTLDELIRIGAELEEPIGSFNGRSVTHEQPKYIGSYNLNDPSVSYQNLSGQIAVIRNEDEERAQKKRKIEILEEEFFDESQFLERYNHGNAFQVLAEPELANQVGTRRFTLNQKQQFIDKIFNALIASKQTTYAESTLALFMPENFNISTQCEQDQFFLKPHDQRINTLKPEYYPPRIQVRKITRNKAFLILGLIAVDLFQDEKLEGKYFTLVKEAKIRSNGAFYKKIVKNFYKNS